MNRKIKKFTKNSLVVVLAVVFALGLAGLIMAATTVGLGTADSFAVLAGSGIVVSNPSTVTGDVGSYPTTTIGGGITILSPGVNHGGDATTQSAKLALVTAYTDASQSPFTTVAANETDSFAGIGTGTGGYTLAPGIYNSGSSMGVPAGPNVLILDGGGDSNAVFIFQAGSTLNTGGSSEVRLTNGTQACNVFWQVGSSATFGTSSNFKGNVLAVASITDAGGSTVTGRLLADADNNGTGAVTLDNSTVTKATCAGATPTPTPAAGGSSVGSVAQNATLNVVKTVINDSGRTKIVADFPLFVTVAGNKIPVISGVTNTFTSPAPAYIVTETSDPNYTQTFSGDCDIDGRVSNNPGDHKFCIVTNNDIGAPLPVVPPLIDVVKVPSPLALPAGPGPVTYTYTLTNIGTVPVTDVTMVGDTCSPIVRVSGDTNGDNKLDVTETWTHTCSTTLSATHTNIVTTTGWANGISAVDIAAATVIVGALVVPPLIHVTKIPSPLALFSGGGAVTYRYTVTNPGTAPLSNVSITDDKCTGLPGRVAVHPGDLNKNDLLESNEAWSFTCQSNLTTTTTSIGTAQGSANGLTARDFAIATVVVAGVLVAPGFPNTGFASMGSSMFWSIATLAGIFAALTYFYFARRKETI